MKIYIDLIIITNILFDFINLLVTNILLKRNAKIIRIILGSIVGAFTMFILFITNNTLIIFIFKIISLALITFITFGKNNIIVNSIYFYTVSIVLGGIINYINNKLSYEKVNMIYYLKDKPSNIIILLILSFVMYLIYIKLILKLKNNFSNIYEVDIYIKSKIYKLSGFIDTGNTIVEPYKKRLVIITNNKDIINSTKSDKFILVPFTTLNKKGLIKCIIPSKVVIKTLGEYKNIVVGLTNKRINNNVSCILNKYLLEI